MPAIPERLAELDHLSLDHGSHASWSQGHCALEVAAYIAGEEHTDHPVCVCPVISAFLISWNDSLPTNADRDRLIKPLLPKILDTRSTPAVALRRSMLAMDWSIREFTPTWLEAAKLTERATELRALPEVASWDALDAAVPVLQKAQADAAAARAAAWDAARAAARDAAWAAARDAARAAARAAAWDAARAAAWVAARDAARAAARAAAWDAARAAARAAAWDAARAAARDAAWAAAWDALAPIVERLQLSAVALIERMIAVTDGP